MILKNYEDYSVIIGEKVILKLRGYYDEVLYYDIFDLNGKNVGYCDLRLEHTKTLYYYGNIGYRIYPLYRGNRYAFYASELLIKLAKTIKMDYLLITVSPENLPSKKTIQNLNFNYIETVKVPLWHPLRFKEPVKEIYEMKLQGEEV